MIAQDLLGVPPDRIEPVAGGGNNRLFRLVSGPSQFALKLYDAQDLTAIARFEREVAALDFLADTPLADRIPGLVSADPAPPAALMEWVEGVPVTERSSNEVPRLLDFLIDLVAAGMAPSATTISLAAESCLTVAELVRQIDRRRARLGEIDAAELQPYLKRFDRLWQTLRRRLSNEDSQELAPGLRVLSPSDFGFHNTLRRPDGRLAFLDFEYFGWDDPAKLACDLLWHPGMQLDSGERSALHSGLLTLYSARDPCFARRFEQVLPAYGMRWCLILLNVFLPERWQRRRFATRADGDDWAGAKQRQLGMAETFLARVETVLEEKVL
ncbi:MAG TPA: aminoglycoside phosphotransferase family protein [Aliidongia sp.]|nr:aminoglycoside phosphotransferase family protein [Aliidongia sp.]